MPMADLKKIASMREMGLAGLIVLVILVVFMRFFYTPQKQSLAEVKTNLAQIQKDQASLKAEVTSLQAKRNVTRPKTEVSSDIRIQILKGDAKPDFSETSEAVERLTRLAGARGMIIDSIASRPPEVKTGYKKVPIQMRGHATFPSIVNLLTDLEGQNALLVVDNFTISTESAVSGEMILDLKSSLFEVEGIHANKN